LASLKHMTFLASSKWLPPFSLYLAASIDWRLLSVFNQLVSTLWFYFSFFSPLYFYCLLQYKTIYLLYIIMYIA
jgi:hypothetical protein